jgi:hypothetical protein
MLQITLKFSATPPMDEPAMAQPVIRTKYFGELPLEENARIEFPWELPGFKQPRWFVANRVPRTQPLVFLQSLEDIEHCFCHASPPGGDPGSGLRLSEDGSPLPGFRPNKFLKARSRNYFERISDVDFDSD